MKIAVLKESAAGETRCAAIPETVKKFSALGAKVAVEQVQARRRRSAMRISRRRGHKSALAPRC
jgi:NAD/NADP transhydrogenase alpha subunit